MVLLPSLSAPRRKSGSAWRRLGRQVFTTPSGDTRSRWGPWRTGLAGGLPRGLTSSPGRPDAAGSRRLLRPCRRSRWLPTSARGPGAGSGRSEGGVGGAIMADRRGIQDLGQDAAVHVAGNGDAQQVEHGRGDVEQLRAAGHGPGPERRPGADEDPLHPMVARRPECRRDQPVRREVVQADRAISPVVEHHGQVGGEVGVRAVIQLVALVDVLDQRLARLGMGDRPERRPSGPRAAGGRPRGPRTPAADAP